MRECFYLRLSIWGKPVCCLRPVAPGPPGNIAVISNFFVYAFGRAWQRHPAQRRKNFGFESYNKGRSGVAQTASPGARRNHCVNNIVPFNIKTLSLHLLK